MVFFMSMHMYIYIYISVMAIQIKTVTFHSSLDWFFFPSALHFSQINDLVYLFFVQWVIQFGGHAGGKLTLTAKWRWSLYLATALNYISLLLSAFTPQQEIRSCLLGVSQKIRFIQWNSRAYPSAIQLSNLPYVEIMSALASSSCTGTTILTMYSRPSWKCCCQCPTVTCW